MHILFVFYFSFSSVLFSSVAFSSVLFSSLFFSSILFSSVSFSSRLLSSAMSVLFYSLLFSLILFFSLLLCSLLFSFVLFCSVFFSYVLLSSSSILLSFVLFCSFWHMILTWFWFDLCFDYSCSKIIAFYSIVLKVTQLFNNNKKQLFAAAPQKILNLNRTVNIILSLLICLASLYHFSP